jgi:metallo-beta-lactamase class B
MKTDLITALFVLSMAFALEAVAQAPVSPPDGSPYRTEPVEPFHIVDNIYFVGTTLHNVSYLITTAEGNIIMDTNFEKSVPQILENVKKLGFKQDDIKLILTPHAHGDHVAGHALMQESTGAEILSSAEDAAVIESGGKSDSESRPWTPAKVDRLYKDGEKISLGGTELTAHLTPGHTKGCTTWTMEVEAEGEKYDVVFVCGVRVNGDSLLDDAGYPHIASDLAGTFKKLKSLPVDIFLGAHGYWYGLGEKIERMRNGEGYKVFIDPAGYRKAIDGWQQQFIDQLVSEAMAKK